MLYRIVLPLVASRPKVYKMKHIFTGESSCCEKCVFWALKFNSLFTMTWNVKKQPTHCVLCCQSQISSSAMNLCSTTPEGLQGRPLLDAHMHTIFFLFKLLCNVTSTWSIRASSEFKPRSTSLFIDSFPCYMSDDRMVTSLPGSNHIQAVLGSLYYCDWTNSK